MSKLVRESISFERGGDPRKTMRVGKLERLKEKYEEEELDDLLHKAVEAGNLNDVKFLIEQGVDVNYEENILLSTASAKGYLDIVKYLVEQGVEIEGYYGSGSPLRAASAEGHLDIVKYLVEHGADINIHPPQHEDYIHSYSLQLAVTGGHLDVVKYLIEQGADLHIGNDFPLRYAIETADNKDVVNYLKSLMNDE